MVVAVHVVTVVVAVVVWQTIELKQRRWDAGQGSWSEKRNVANSVDTILRRRCAGDI